MSEKTIQIPIIEDELSLVRTFDAAVAELKVGALMNGCELSAIECTALLQTMETVRLKIVEVQENSLNEVTP